MSNNQEIAKLFEQIAIYFEMDDVAFKPQAYRKASLILEAMSEDVADVYKKGGTEALEEFPGIGKNIADKIIEYLEKGKIKEHQRLKKKIPVNLDELMAVEGVGPKIIKDLYKKLKVKNLKDLEKSAKAGKIRNLPNFGLKTEQNILESIKFLKRDKGRFTLGEILPTARNFFNKLKELKEVKEISFAGSLRRRKETIGDVDILIVSNKPKVVTDFFVSLPEVVKVWGKGSTKASVRMKKARLPDGQGFDVDIRIVSQESYGSALQYFTGSKEHNIATRKIAIDKGLKLNEYGVFKGKKQIAGKNEKEVYKAIGLPYIEPEMRENKDEVEIALRQAQSKLHKLPKLINHNDIIGDLHCHVHWNDKRGKKLKEMVGMAMKMGYQYIGISDHTKFLAIEHGLDEKQLASQRKFIDKLNLEFKKKKIKFKVLQGCEANIMPNGSIDIKDTALAKLDYVIAGVHSQLKMSKEKMTERIITAMRNPNVDIISHITSRVLQVRPESELDFDKILEVAKETGTILEINANPHRLDLKDTNIRKAKEKGVKMIINSDAHQSDQMELMEYGISQARRGWAEKGDIVNAWPLEKFLTFLKN